MNNTAKKLYFAKFTGLPYSYDTFKASNKTIAEREFAKYRDDTVIFDPSATIISWADYYDQRYKKIDVKESNYHQYDEAKGTLFSGEKTEFLLRRQDHLNALRNLFAHYPGAVKGNLFESNGTFTFTVRATNGLADYIYDNNIISDLSKEQIRKQVDKTSQHFPIFIYNAKKTNKKPESGMQLKDFNIKEKENGNLEFSKKGFIVEEFN